MKTVNISLDNSSKEILSSQILSSIDCIPLETNDTLLLDAIRKVVVKDDFYYVSDAHAIYKFDSKGGFKAVINCLGAGPNEFAHLSDFQIDDKGLAWILSSDSKTLKQYNWESALLQTINLKHLTNFIQIAEKNSMILYASDSFGKNDESKIEILDLSTQKIIGEQLPKDKRKSKYLHIMAVNAFSSPNKDNSPCYFFQSFNDTIYEASTSRVKPFINLNFGEYNIPPSIFEAEYENIMFFFKAIHGGNYAYGTALFVEAKNNYYTSFIYNKDVYFSDISKETLTSNNAFTQIKETSLLDGYVIDLSENRIFAHEGELIIPITPYDIVEYGKENLTPKEQKELEKKIGYKTMDQNPVLLRLKLK
jgi:hypothetical protein